MTLDAIVPIAVGALVVILSWTRRMTSLGEVWPPPELRGARLVYAEQLFRMAEPVSISARVDRVYRSASGALVLVELKTRVAKRVYRSDVIELSAQRLAVMAQTGAVVSNHAFVLIERTDGRRTGCHRVTLLASADVIALATRRQALLSGTVEPLFACSAGLCQKCSFVKQCAPFQG